MYELLYTSVSPPGLSEADLQDILEKSWEKNRRLGITGMLIYHEREIIQLLEGEQQAVQSLYTRIAEDDRHTHVRVVYEGPIQSRAFLNWSMAFTRLSAGDMKMFADSLRGLVQQCLEGSLKKACPNPGKQLFISMKDRL